MFLNSFLPSFMFFFKLFLLDDLLNNHFQFYEIGSFNASGIHRQATCFFPVLQTGLFWLALMYKRREAAWDFSPPSRIDNRHNISNSISFAWICLFWLKHILWKFFLKKSYIWRMMKQAQWKVANTGFLVFLIENHCTADFTKYNISKGQNCTNVFPKYIFQNKTCEVYPVLRCFSYTNFHVHFSLM